MELVVGLAGRPPQSRGRIAAVLALAVMIGCAAGPAAAACVEGKRAACFDARGCRGERECVGGRWTGCMVDPDACVPPAPGDLVRVDGAPGQAQVGLCVDGYDASGEVDDRRFGLQGSAPVTAFDVGQLEASSAANEVIAFAAGRAPTRVDAAWTPGLDRVPLAIVPTVRVPVTVWVVTAPGTFGQEALRALGALVGAGALLDAERVGLDWNAVDLRDATGDPEAAAHQNFAGPLWTLERDIGHVARRINVYWMPLVNGSSGNGVGETAHGDALAVGRDVTAGLLAHEIGHCLALDHVDGDPRFDDSNVMTSNGGTREYFTEGQAFRAHVRSISAIRSTRVYGLRPDLPLRDACDIATTTRTCPRADKRLWRDGPRWPAN